MTGFEPATCWSQTSRATKLRYTPWSSDGGIRTHTWGILSALPLPIGLRRLLSSLHLDDPIGSGIKNLVEDHITPRHAQPTGFAHPHVTEPVEPEVEESKTVFRSSVAYECVKLGMYFVVSIAILLGKRMSLELVDPHRFDHPIPDHQRHVLLASFDIKGCLKCCVNELLDSQYNSP